MTPASNRAQQGFVRIVNRSARAGTVRIHAIDDTGRRFGPVSLPFRAKQTRHFTSVQLEQGGAGLSAGVGNGTGNWRLELATSLDIEPLAYIRAAGGFVTDVHEAAAETQRGARRIYHVPFFFPGSNQRQVSSLRLINPGSGNAGIVITGVDDWDNASPGGAVRLTLRGGAARMVTAQQLESGRGLSGRLGDGAGYWQLSISANRPIVVMSLLRSPSGHLVNLSRGGAESPGGPSLPAGPDLVVRPPTVGNASPSAGQSFVLRATVRNQGRARSAATRLRYYRSSDATITTRDTLVGTDAVSALAPSGTSPESIGLRAPARAGTYYYGACVMSVSGESNAANNCSSAVKVTVGRPAPAHRPDLAFVTRSELPRVNPGESFRFGLGLVNQGDGPSGPTTLRFYRSTDATISTTDTPIATWRVGALSPGMPSALFQLSLTAPARAGTYYYGGCVDPVPRESDTSNNCSSANALTVGPARPPNRPDLVAQSPSVDDNSLNAGQFFLFSVVVRNQGTAAAAATRLRIYRSTDATIMRSDTQVQSSLLHALPASGGINMGFTLIAPSGAGTYYYGACVDGVSGESDTRNNCSSGVRVRVSG